MDAIVFPGNTKSAAAVVMNQLKEPLFHFLLAGAALFGAYTWTNRATEKPAADKAAPCRFSAVSNSLVKLPPFKEDPT